MSCVHCGVRPATLQCHACPTGADTTGNPPLHTHEQQKLLVLDSTRGPRLLCLPCDAVSHMPRARRLHVRAPWPATSDSEVECCAWCDEADSPHNRLRWECSDCGALKQHDSTFGRVAAVQSPLAAPSGNAPWRLHDTCHRYLHAAATNSHHQPRERSAHERALGARSPHALPLGSDECEELGARAHVPWHGPLALRTPATAAITVGSHPSTTPPPPLAAPADGRLLTLSPTAALSPRATPDRPDRALGGRTVPSSGVLSLAATATPITLPPFPLTAAASSARHRRALSTPVAFSGVLALGERVAPAPMRAAFAASTPLALTPASRRTRSYDREATPATTGPASSSSTSSLSTSSSSSSSSSSPAVAVIPEVEMLELFMMLPCLQRVRIAFGPHTRVADLVHRTFLAEQAATLAMSTLAAASSSSTSSSSSSLSRSSAASDIASFARRVRISFARTGARLRERSLTLREYGVAHRAELVATLDDEAPLQFSRTVLGCAPDALAMCVDAAARRAYLCTRDVVVCQQWHDEFAAELRVNADSDSRGGTDDCTVWTIGRRHIQALEHIHAVALVARVVLIVSGARVLALHADTGALLCTIGGGDIGSHTGGSSSSSSCHATSSVLREPRGVAAGLLSPPPSHAGALGTQLACAWIADAGTRSVQCFELSVTAVTNAGDTSAVALHVAARHAPQRTLGAREQRTRHTGDAYVAAVAAPITAVHVDGRLHSPVACAWSAARGCVFVCDAAADRVCVYSDLNGAFIASIGGVERPRALCLDDDGDAVYVVCDADADAESDSDTDASTATERGCVRAFDASSLLPRGCVSTHAVADTDSEADENERYERERGGARVAPRRGGSGSAQRRVRVLGAPRAVCFEARARHVYVLDTELRRVSVFHAMLAE